MGESESKNFVSGEQAKQPEAGARGTLVDLLVCSIAGGPPFYIWYSNRICSLRNLNKGFQKDP